VRVTRHRYAVEGWGVGELVVADGLVLAHELPEPGRRLEGPRHERGVGQPLAGVVADRVRGHLRGEPSSYEDLPLDLSWCSTSFQTELACTLRSVPWGEVVSYGELAALAGRPGAARAAGTFCAQNRFSLMLPCHRVVSSSGIGGYGASGVTLKRRLLALEGVAL
jgi:methylated-DNA-[protein]-cysteine S-methyltransferase